MCVQYLWRPEEGDGSPGSRILVENCHEASGNQTQVLGKQQLLWDNGLNPVNRILINSDWPLARQEVEVGQ